MKHFIRVYVFNVFAIWMTTQIFPALKIHGPLSIVLLAGLIFSGLVIFVKPLLKILFIPINLLTFGLLAWTINVILLYALTFFVPEVTVSSWVFPGIQLFGFVIPKIDISYWPALVLSSFFITLISNFLHDLTEK